LAIGSTLQHSLEGFRRFCRVGAGCFVKITPHLLNPLEAALCTCASACGRRDAKVTAVNRPGCDGWVSTRRRSAIPRSTAAGFVGFVGSGGGLLQKISSLILSGVRCAPQSECIEYSYRTLCYFITYTAFVYYVVLNSYPALWQRRCTWPWGCINGGGDRQTLPEETPNFNATARTHR
jgi:hypothetical protein